jgi:hypothetical protein
MKRNTRTAWGVSGLLALALSVGGTAFINWGQRTGAFLIEWEPVGGSREWRVGKSTRWDECDTPAGPMPVKSFDVYSLGFVTFAVPYR